MTPLTKNQVFEIIGRLEAEIRALGVSRLAVFGSVARGEARPDSDVDILVHFSPGSKTFERFLVLSELLEASLGRRIELVTTEVLSPFIESHVLAEAQDVIRGEDRKAPDCKASVIAYIEGEIFQCVLFRDMVTRESGSHWVYL
jgi:hypothetical protein